MDVATTCPACGAVLAAAPEANEITCEFCGNRFALDLTGVSPVLRPAGSSREMPEPPPAPAAPEPVSSFLTPEPPAAAAEPTYVSTPPAPVRSTTSFLSGRPVWIIIAVVVAMLLCVLFACLAMSSLVVNLSR